MNKPPWMQTKSKRVAMTERALAKVQRVADIHGLPFTKALDALIEGSDEALVPQQLKEDTVALNAWRALGE